MKARRFLSFGWIPLVFCLGAGSAAAQDLAAAEALFDKGVSEMAAGRFDTACPALAESQRLDPRPGTLFALADCHDQAGRIATAAALYDDYLRAVAQMTQAYKLRHLDRAKTAQARKAALAAEIPELTLVLPASAPAAMRIARDGAELSAASLGVALPLDPGEHVITVQVGGVAAREQRVTLGRGEKKTVEVEAPVAGPGQAAEPARAAAPKASGAAAPARARGATPARQPAPAPEAEGGMSGRQIGALVAGGIGVAGLALGGVTGAMVLSKRSIVEEHCDGLACDVEGKAAADGAKLPGTLSTIGFGVGAAGIATGLVLWLTAPSPAAVGAVKSGVQARVNAGPAGAAVGVEGVW